MHREKLDKKHLGKRLLISTCTSTYSEIREQYLLEISPNGNYYKLGGDGADICPMGWVDKDEFYVLDVLLEVEDEEDVSVPAGYSLQEEG